VTRGSARIGLGGSKRLILALFSFEALFVLFLFSGNYKPDPRLAWVPIDLSICLFAMTFAMGMAIIWRERLYLPGLTVVAIAGVFVTWAAVTHLWTPSTIYAQEKLIKLTVLNLWCSIAAAMIMANRPERIRRLLLLLVVFGTAASVDGIIQYATADEFALSASFSLPNYLGQARLYGMGALVAFGLWLHADPFSRRGVVLMSVFGVCLYAMLIAGARGPMLSVGAAMLLPLALGVRLPRQRLLVSKALLTSVVLFAVTAAVLVHLATVSPDSLRAFQRFGTLLNAEGGGTSVSRRLDIWPATLQLWAEQPLVGQGIGSWPVLYLGEDISSYPHNLILEVLVEFGLVGFMLLAAIIAVAWSRVTLERLRAEPALMAAAMLCISTFLYSMTTGDLSDNRTLFAMLGLLVMRPTRTVTRAGTEGRPSRARAVDVRPAYVPEPMSAARLRSAASRSSGSRRSNPHFGRAPSGATGHRRSSSDTSR
jgi:O-antigen ligase